jgi:hypothetical protein
VFRYLLPGPLFNARFTIPDVQFPGTLYWKSNTFNISSVGTIYEREIRILIDEETQSAAEYDAMILEQHRPSLKIGSQTAGADGNISMVYLPGNVQTAFTGLGTFYPDGRPAQRIGIVPDVLVSPTIEGLRQQRDEVLEAALQQKLLTSVAIQRTPSLPEQFALSQNYPNPFNPSTTISYQLPKASRVSLKVFNTLGQQVAMLIDEEKSAGYHQARWDAALPSGVYFYRLQAGGYLETKRMILLR